jgi:hypothetical protein
MRIFFFGVFFWVMALTVEAQKMTTEKSVITFFSDAAIEDIRAENVRLTCIINLETHDIAFSVPINQFQFDKKLMQEHFNEKYMESDRFPVATFAGKLEGFRADASGQQPVIARGKLTIHGVTREVTIPGKAEMINQKLTLSSTFTVRLEDYQVKIPQLLWQNIAEAVEVSLTVTLRNQ